MKKTAVLLVAVLIGMSLVGCGKNKGVCIEGSTSVGKLMGALSETFENETGIKVSYNSTGSGAGIQSVIEGRCDIGLSSRELKESEKASGLKATVLAYDGIAVIVNNENKITDLNMTDIARIFKGEIVNWNQIGGNDGEIVLVGRESGSGTRDAFESATECVGNCKYRQELTSNGDVITVVAGNPNAIGYASLAATKNSVKLLTVNGVTPTAETVKNGSYTVRRPFILVTNENIELSVQAQSFFNYITSDKARDIISSVGAVPVN